jgi:hypothetical protein
MSSQAININQYRKSKSRARVLEALAHFQSESLTHLTDENNSLDLEAFEEFMAQVLGDHLAGQLADERKPLAGSQSKASGVAAGVAAGVAESYRRFNSRLKKRLQAKLKSRQLFDAFS